MRLVDEKDLRLPPAKGWYAYRVELVLVGILVGFPIALLMAVFSNSAGMIFLPLLIGSTYLLCLRIISFGKNFMLFYSAGCIALSAQAFLFISPLLLLMMASVMGMTASGSSWTIVSALLILGMILSLPYLYMKRVTFAVMMMPFIFLTAVGSFNASLRLSGAPIDTYCSITVAPGILICILLLKCRQRMGSIWDVSLIIRPIDNAEFKPMWIVALFWEIMENFKKEPVETVEPVDAEEGFGICSYFN